MKRLGLHPLHPDEARRVHRGEIAPASAKAAAWPNLAELVAAQGEEDSCEGGGCGCSSK
jgi:hypothetical protein